MSAITVSLVCIILALVNLAFSFLHLTGAVRLPLWVLILNFAGAILLSLGALVNMIQVIVHG